MNSIQYSLQSSLQFLSVSKGFSKPVECIEGLKDRGMEEQRGGRAEDMMEGQKDGRAEEGKNRETNGQKE